MPIPAESDRDEADRIRRWRYQQARENGLGPIEADVFARSNIDVGDLRHLAAKGCPPELISRVLL